MTVSYQANLIGFYNGFNWGTLEAINTSQGSLYWSWNGTSAGWQPAGATGWTPILLHYATMQGIAQAFDDIIAKASSCYALVIDALTAWGLAVNVAETIYIMSVKNLLGAWIEQGDPEATPITMDEASANNLAWALNNLPS